MNPDRQHWNQQQKALSALLSRRLTDETHPRAVELFLSQHAMIHAAEMSGCGLWSFEDEVCADLSEAAWRIIPPKGEHSIAWMVWHVTRIEDITMNLLVNGSPQVMAQGGWLARLQVSARDTGSAMDAAEIAALSKEMDIAALREYRLAVGRRTREIISGLPREAFGQPIAPERLQRVLDEGGVLESARWLVEYWGGHKIGGLLLMPPTRHPFVHWNEALRVKAKVC